MRPLPQIATPTALPPQQPWLHELEIATNGNTTVLSDRQGDIGAAGTGIFVDDRRVVSHFTVRLEESAISRLVSSSRGAHSSFLGSARRLGDAGADPTVEVHRERQVGPAKVTERITVVSRATAIVRASVVIDIAGDGASIASVKTGHEGSPALSPAQVGSGVTWSDELHETRVSLTPAPTERSLGSDHAPSSTVFDLELPAWSSQEIVVEISTTRRRPSAFDADAASGLLGWSEVHVQADDARFGRAVSTALVDLQHLLLSDPLAPRDVFAAAGTPWYLTLFGRDSLWTARLMLPLGTDLARGTLRALARRQGGVAHDISAQEPGKILHEVRREAFIDDESGLTLPPVYYGTVDATQLWICVLHDAWRWGMADEDVVALLPHLQAALAWLQAATKESPDGFIRYVDRAGSGLVNQGWKDSGDSMRCADGRVAPAPIALLEAQTYAVEAATKAAILYEHFGLADAESLRQWARDLTERIQDRFWVGSPDDPYLAMAMDGEGRPVDGVGSNMGHALGTGVLSPADEARVVERLRRPDLLGEFGVATLSRSNPAYNPVGYHTGSVWTHDTAICAVGMVRAGHFDEAAPLVRALIDVASLFDYRWPELFSGDPVLHHPAPYPASCRPQAWSAASAGGLITAIFGLDADVPGRRLTLRPMRPSPVGRVRVTGLWFADSEFTIDLSADGVVHVSGLPDNVEVLVLD